MEVVAERLWRVTDKEECKRVQCSYLDSSLSKESLGRGAWLLTCQDLIANGINKG